MRKRDLINQGLIVALALAGFFVGANARAEPTAIAGQSTNKTYDMSSAMNPPGYCQITVTTTPTALSALLAGGQGGSCAPPKWAAWAQFLPEDGSTISVRCAADGTSLSSSLGMPVFGSVKNAEPAAGGFAGWSCVSATGANVTMDIWFLG